jgi:hypothetical protein
MIQALKWVFLTILMLAILIGGVNYWQLQEMRSLGGHSEWFRCQSDDQCVVTRVTCADRGVNKLYEEQVHEADTYSCSAKLGDIHPAAQGKCISNECNAVVPEWYNCQKDDDCIRVDGVCGGDAAVNKNFVTDYKKFNTRDAQCAAKKLPQTSIQVKCIRNLCFAISLEMQQ